MLVQACLDGDRGAFDTLVTRYERQLYAAAYAITRNVDDAMDATQSAFLNAYTKLGTFNPERRFFSWIYRIAVNQALNLVARRRPATPVEAAILADNPGPEARVASGQELGQLVRALSALPDDQRTLVVLKHLVGASYRELAELLGIEEKTVKSRLFSARRRLRHLLLAGERP